MSNPADINRITNELIAMISTAYDQTTQKFIEPIDPLQLSLYKIVMRKQLHTCMTHCQHNKSKCKHRFPLNIQNENQSTFDSNSSCWIYYLLSIMKFAMLLRTMLCCCS